MPGYEPTLGGRRIVVKRFPRRVSIPELTPPVLLSGRPNA